MLDRGQRAEHRGVEHEDVERLPALGDGRRQLGDRFAVGEVERGDGRGAAGGVDAVVDRFERAGGAGDQDDMRAGGGQRFGGRRADPAAGAGDERQLAGEGLVDSSLRDAAYRLATRDRRAGAFLSR